MMEERRRRYRHFVGFGMLLSLSLFVKGNAIEDLIGINGRSFSSEDNHSAVARKLLLSPDDKGDGNRIGTECSKDDIGIMQGPTAPMPNGVPAYTVEIVNGCVSGCSIAEIHVSCGWFTSVRLINPRIFRRVSYDDCLVNDGMPLGPGQILSFQYANSSFPYPLSVSSVSCF
ncbi:PREDICTED: LOW QUALITY PROTEIN: TPD1 protein homolog 1 [Tarenaya hassleriana]|uniref:LOW QUALITY PROTEIN: TPD1 protein homolog 1 n=1 Tax=Tarenaya hassleriana TaxID=28532 RepID=UPI00053C17AF|nr:PREDICTED: LOW QUALITY PROTEIN: TPD1 protein homolog 1 [Tarenaya hassleriana]